MSFQQSPFPDQDLTNPDEAHFSVYAKAWIRTLATCGGGRGNSAMRDHVAETGRENTVGRYVVCAGGYPIADLPTFEAAAAQARILCCFRTNDEFSIYEVESGIHFDVPLNPRDGGMAAEAHESFSIQAG